ncbi:VOC family protein [Chloroflexi bacterium TSY]|nr:VOC family protein [Chloroflexi bacterium TSY]
MKINGLIEVILYVQEMNQQVSFYRDILGFAIEYPADLEDYSNEFWVVLNTGVCKLALHGGGEQRLGDDAPKLVFGVDEINAARDALLQQGVTVSEVRTPAPGVSVVDALDPEGNKFSVESHG